MSSNHTSSSQPIGPAVPGWSARPAPPSTPIEGRYVRVERLDPGRHAHELFEAHRGDPEGRNWTYLFAEKPRTPEAFRDWVEKAASTEDPFFHAIVDRRDGKAAGVAALMRIDRVNGVIEVGHINFSPRLQRTREATEAIYLLMRRAFDELGYRRFEWKCDHLNAPSRAAALRLGFAFEGIFRQAVIYKGRSRDTAWFSIIDAEWPRVKAAFEAWLDPANFDASGRQKRRLEEFRAASPPYHSGMNAFDEAASYARAHEVPWTRDPLSDPAHWGVHHDDPPPFNRLRGPVHPRGGVSGVIRLRGEEVAAWGEPDRADQTFSVAKTYLALLAGIAHARGLIDPSERVADRVPGIGFDSPHNRAITWEHLLTQTSEWQGECFGMPDRVEHYRRVSYDPKPPEGKKGERRELHAPGTYWEYNDVRINQLSLALLHVFQRPLPELFLENVLRPLGGGRDFRWEGYDDSWVEIGGRRIQSVPGGTHWGGGVSISARDQARIGQLLLDGGAHEGRQLIPRDWVQRMQAPNAIAPFYGLLTWLNRDGRMFADASRASWFMFGAGGHMTWIDPDHRLVVVSRWLDGAHSAGFVTRVMQALR